MNKLGRIFDFSYIQKDRISRRERGMLKGVEREDSLLLMNYKYRQSMQE